MYQTEELHHYKTWLKNKENLLIRLWDLTEEASVYFFWDFLRGSDLSQGLGLLQ